MNRKETLALFFKGRIAWNAWAEDMLVKRKALEDEGRWDADTDLDGKLEGKNEVTKAWVEDARADFSSQEDPRRFENGTNFTSFRFPSDSIFDSATFAREEQSASDAHVGDKLGHPALKGVRIYGSGSDNASLNGGPFGGARFEGSVGFDDATFEEGAGFSDATFEGNARFDGATFESVACFDKARFEGRADFGNSSFNGPTTFGAVHFEKLADFSAVRANRAFTLEDARFERVPDFIQAHFLQAPRFDNTNLRPDQAEPGGFWASILAFVDPNLRARYQALKRLAIKSHDNDYEHLFRAGEFRSKRSLRGEDNGGDHNIWRLVKPSWWINILYELFSDFGRSLVRPFVVWLAVIAFMTWVHVSNHNALNSFVAHNCSPNFAALHVSVETGMLGIGRNGAQKTAQDFACLYGLSPNFKPPSEGGKLVPNVPYRIVFWQMGQTVISAVLIFLFLLALRNHFKLK